MDVVFLGPYDLTTDLGIAGQFDHPLFIEALETVTASAAEYGKVAGLLVPDLDRLGEYVEMGFTFLIVGMDGRLLTRALRDLRDHCDRVTRPESMPEVSK